MSRNFLNNVPISEVSASRAAFRDVLRESKAAFAGFTFDAADLVDGDEDEDPYEVIADLQDELEDEKRSRIATLQSNASLRAQNDLLKKLLDQANATIASLTPAPDPEPEWTQPTGVAAMGGLRSTSGFRW